MAKKYRGTKFHRFLCELKIVPVKFEYIAMQIRQQKRHVHKHIRDAEQLGIEFHRTRANGGLYELAIDFHCQERLKQLIKWSQ